MLRGLVAVAILISHYGRETFWGTLVGPVETGSLRVAVFFVLSGVVLGYSYVQRDGFSIAKFYIRRISKLIPVIWPTLIPLVFVMGSASAFNIFVYITFTQAWYPPTALIINPPVWSLSVQFLFYLVFPFTLIFAKKGTAHKAFWCLLFVYWLVEVIWLHHMMASQAFAEFDVFTRGLVFSFPATQYINFFVGVAAGVALSNRTKAVSFIGRNSSLILCLSVALLLLGNFYPIELMHAFNSKTVYHGVTWTPVITLFLMALALSNSSVVLILQKEPMQWFGRMSFAIFAWHVPIHAVAVGFFGKEALASAIGFNCYLLVVLVFSYASARYWEYLASKRAEQMLNRVFRQR